MKYWNVGFTLRIIEFGAFRASEVDHKILIVHCESRNFELSSRSPNVGFILRIIEFGAFRASEVNHKMLVFHCQSYNFELSRHQQLVTKCWIYIANHRVWSFSSFRG